MKRKLINFWRTLMFRWIKPEDTDPKDYLKVQILNEESDILHEVLGITEERRDALTRECEVLLTKYEDTSRAASEMSKQILHANELFYCAYLISHIVEHKRKMGSLAQMFMGGGSKRSKKGPDKSED